MEILILDELEQFRGTLCEFDHRTAFDLVYRLGPILPVTVFFLPLLIGLSPQKQ